MKKTILTIAIAAVFASCSDKPADQTTTTTTSTINATDTTGLSQFNKWKEEQEVVNMKGVDVEQPVTEEVAATPKREAAPATRIIYRDRPAKSQPVARYSKPRTYGTPATPSREATSRNDVPSGVGSGESTGSGTGVGTGVGNEPVVSAPAPEVKKKEGWSKAAKGTAIGAGSGAVLGAIISKKKGTGAIIGGVIGAAGGYVLGRSQDKKDGRY